MLKYVSILILIFFASVSYANETSTLRCEFNKYSNDKASNQEDNLVLTFLFDFTSKKTYLLGNNGSSLVESVLNNQEQSMTFIEITKAGNVLITTVDQKTNRAVHSRHTLFNGKLLPAQYYGSCKMI